MSSKGKAPQSSQVESSKTDPKSYRLPADTAPSSSGSSDSEDLDEGCSDWASSFGEARHTKSLFDETTYDSPEEALRSDEEKHGFGLDKVCEEWGLDMYGRIRLVNLIRRDALSASDALKSDQGGAWRTDDALLIPVIPDDPLLQFGFDDAWSDDGFEAGPSNPQQSKSANPSTEVEQLRKELATAQMLLQQTLDDTEPISKGKKRDDDTHYFDSYAENDIHEIMLKDTTRTVTYARFILSNPEIFKDAIVMDVGCGTGILSMFAAKAGAKRVYAVEASGLASKARENIKNNGWDKIITVIQSKVEEITVDEKVDVVISEWMGYMLLYESMLDSVLYARDNFMREGGLMAPSQTRLVIEGITGERIWRDRIDFWKSVYGFDMTAMNGVYFDEGLVEVVDPKEVVTTDAILRDINTQTATPKSLDFHSSFSITAQSSTTIRAFLTYFDTFFSTKQESIVDTTFIPDALDEVKPVPGIASFTTGPQGKETHWRQVAFLLRKPIEVQKGDVINGRFYCRKSSTNSRELDVEIHYGTSDFTVQLYKVR